MLSVWVTVNCRGATATVGVEESEQRLVNPALNVGYSVSANKYCSSPWSPRNVVLSPHRLTAKWGDTENKHLPCALRLWSGSEAGKRRLEHAHMWLKIKLIKFCFCTGRKWRDFEPTRYTLPSPFLLFDQRISFSSVQLAKINSDWLKQVKNLYSSLFEFVYLIIKIKHVN